MTKITDFGCGINENQISTIFSTFNIWSLNMHERETYGIGIGLSTAKILVESVGG